MDFVSDDAWTATTANRRKGDRLGGVELARGSSAEFSHLAPRNGHAAVQAASLVAADPLMAALGDRTASKS